MLIRFCFAFFFNFSICHSFKLHCHCQHRASNDLQSHFHHHRNNWTIVVTRIHHRHGLTKSGKSREVVSGSSVNCRCCHRRNEMIHTERRMIKEIFFVKQVCFDVLATFTGHDVNGFYRAHVHQLLSFRRLVISHRHKLLHNIKIKAYNHFIREETRDAEIKEKSRSNFKLSWYFHVGILLKTN